MKIQKKYLKISVLFISIWLAFSCDDFLESESNSAFTEEKAFSNLDFATKAVLGIYSQLTVLDMFEYELGLFFAMDNDVEHVLGTDDSGRKQLARYKGTEGSSTLATPWQQLYRGIERANMCIDNLPKSPIWNGEYASEVHRLYAEALTLRALLYYELIINWGDVPFSIHSVQNGDNFYQPKTDRDEIYEYLLKELEEAQKNIPWMRESQTAERITKGYVKGLRARMALSYAGYSLRNKTFETRRGRNWQEYYAIARKECLEVMQSGKHELNPDYEGIFRMIHSYQQDLRYNEILFEVAFGRGYSGRLGQSIGMAHTTNPPDPRFGRAGAEVGSNPYYFYSFDTKDLRRNVNIELYNYGNTSYLGMQRLLSYNGYRVCKWRRSWIVPTMGGDEKEVSSTGINFPLMRYSDIVLMFAEAENEINGPTQDAKNALISVRKRAFAEEFLDRKVYHYVDSVSASKNDFFNAIVNERAWEFGGEMIRKFDLVRWNLLGAKLREAREKNISIINDAPGWQWVPNNMFWKYNDDGYTMTILNQDYRLPSTAISGYTRTTWLSGLGANDKNNFINYINQIADGYDEQKNNHLRPISSIVLAQSNGSLANDQMP